MDVPRTQKRRNLRWPAIVVGTLSLAVAAFAATGSLQPAAPSVARAGVVLATVQRGVFERDVRASGRLVPQETRWVTAITPGRVDSITAKPGARVTADTVILTLQNPDVVLASLEAEREVTTARATALELETQLGTQAIEEAASVATLEAELANAERRARIYGADLGLVVSQLEQVQIAEQATALGRKLELARERVQLVKSKGGGAIAAWREQLSRRQKVAEFRQTQVQALAVRAGGEGILADIPVEPGQWAPPGAVLASVIKPELLKAELRIPEGQTTDIALGMSASIDTHNGVIPGHVMRVATTARDGAVLVEVALDGAQPSAPRRARPCRDARIHSKTRQDNHPAERRSFAPEYGERRNGKSTLRCLLVNERANFCVRTRQRKHNVPSLMIYLENGALFELAILWLFETQNRQWAHLCKCTANYRRSRSYRGFRVALGMTRSRFFDSKNQVFLKLYCENFVA